MKQREAEGGDSVEDEESEIEERNSDTEYFRKKGRLLNCYGHYRMKIIKKKNSKMMR